MTARFLVIQGEGLVGAGRQEGVWISGALRTAGRAGAAGEGGLWR